MIKRLEPEGTEKDLGRDLSAFEQLPEKTKEVLKLKEQAARATGPDQIAIDQKIKDEMRKPRP